MADTATDTAMDLHSDAANVRSTPHPNAAHGFQPGFDPRRNLAGRLPKKRTVWDETQALASRRQNRKAIAAAAVETMKTPHSVAGSRERALFHDRDVGRVVEEFHITQDASPLDVLLMRRAERSLIVEGQTVEGEAREVDADGDGAP